MKLFTTPSADVSAAILAARIRNQEPTAFFRFGDGAVECINGTWKPATPHTCDGERYSKELAVELDNTIFRLGGHGQVFIGDWRTATSPGSRPNHVEAWLRMFPPEYWQFLHFEALLLMRRSEALVDFYRAVRADKRRKLFIGPAANAGGAYMMKADHLIVPDRELFSVLPGVQARIDALDPQVVLFGAGMAGNIPVVRHWAEHPDRTYIALGSALDPLFRGRSRSNQLRPEQARELFRELL